MAQYGEKGNENKKGLSIDDAFTSIDTMWLYNFMQYRKTLDLNWFIDGYDGRQKKLSHELLIPIENKISNEYYEATQDRGFELMINRFAKINYLQTFHYNVSVILDRMYRGFGSSKDQQLTRKEYIDTLAMYKFKMNLIATSEEDKEALEQISSQLQGIKTKIAIIENEMKTTGSKEAVSTEKQLLIMGYNLGAIYGHAVKINPKESTVREWVENIKILEENSKQN